MGKRRFLAEPHLPISWEAARSVLANHLRSIADRVEGGLIVGGSRPQARGLGRLFLSDKGSFEVESGDTWVPVGVVMQHGKVQTTATGRGDITFDPPFSDTPKLFLSPHLHFAEMPMIASAHVVNVDASSAQIQVAVVYGEKTTVSLTSLWVDWLAIGG